MYQHTPSFLVDMKKRRTIRVLAILVFLVTILTGGWSFFTEYQIQQVRSEGGIALEVAGDEGIAHVSQSGYRVKKGDIGWYKRGDIANVKETTRTGYTFLGWYQDTTKVSDSNPYSHTMTAATKLVAKTKINSYRITAELDGGTINGSPSWSQTYTIKDTVTLPTPVKTGYNFLGWVEKGANNTPNKNVVIPVGSTGDKTFVAKWEIKKFKVNVNGILDGGTEQETTKGMGTFDVYVNGDLLQNKHDWYDYVDNATPYGTQIEIKNIKAETGKTYVKSSQSLKFTVTGNVKITLYFKTNEYTYRFNANGGTGSIADIKAKHGTSVKIPTSTFKKDYHTQTNWNTAAGGTGTSYKLEDTISGYSGKDGDVVTLYAQWRKNKVQISLHANGSKMGASAGSYFSLDAQSFVARGGTRAIYEGEYGGYVKDSTNSLPDIQYTGNLWLERTGYHYNPNESWNTKSDGSGKSYSENGGILAKDFADLKDSDKSVTLYANWKPNNYKVRYNGNGATSGTMTDSVHVYDTAKALTRNAYARTGYTFTGWNTKHDGKGTAYADGASVKNLTSNKDGVVTLYAQWKANSYTLTYDANGGTVSTSSKTLQYGDAFGILPTPKRDGHKFLGWYTSATGGTKVSETTKIDAKNTTIYAHWDAYTLSINYHGDGAEYLHDFDFDENKELGLVNVTGKDIVKVQTVRYGSKLPDYGLFDGGRFKKTGYTAENLVMLLKGGTSISTQVPYTAVELATKAGKQDAFKTGNVSIDIYPKWTVNTYTNEITHWAGGFKDQEGNNYEKTYFKLRSTTFSSSYNSKFTLDASQKIEIPNGFHLNQDFGSDDISSDGSWTRYPFGTQVTQKAQNMSFEYDYLPSVYKITYNLNGGTNNSANPSYYNVLYGVSLKNPTRIGYTFDGWESNLFNLAQQKFMCINNVSGNELSNAKMQVWKDGKFLVQPLTVRSVGDASKKYIHNYDTGMYTIRLAANGNIQDGGSYYAENVYLEKGKTYTFSFRVEEASKSKYVISNVKVNKDGGTKVTGINEGKKANFATSAELYSELAKRTIGDVALEARWTPNKYTLSFNPNGGTVNPTSKTVSYGSPYGDLPTPTKSGNTFLGWFTEKDGGTQVSSTTTMGASNVTLYAHWKLDIRDTVLGDRSVFSGTFGQYIKNNSYIYSIEIGTEGSGSLEATYDVSKNQDNSVKARVYRQNYMYYTISIMPETGYRMVAPDNCVRWFAWDATDLSRIQSISISQVDFKNTRNMSHMFNYCGIRDVTLRGINNKNIVMNGMFEGCDSLQSITVDSLWRFDSSIGLDGIWTNGGIDYGGNTLPSYRDATYYKSTSYVYLETGAELQKNLSSLITSYPSKVAIVFGTPSGGLFGNAIDVSESKDGSVLMNWGYSGGSMSSGVIYIYPSDSTKKIALNTESRGMFDSLYNNVPITVDFGTNAVTDVLTRNTSTSLVWHASSDLKYTGDDICGLVSNPNNRSIQLQSDDVDNEQVTSPDVDTPDTQKDTDTTDSQKGTDISDESLAIDTPDVQEDINTEVTDSNDVLHEESSQVGGIEEVIE